MVLEVVEGRLPVDRRFVAVRIVGVRDRQGSSRLAGDAVVVVVGVACRAVDQRDAVRQRRRGGSRSPRDGLGQAIADVIIAIGDGGIRPGFLGQLALIVVGVVGCAAARRLAGLGDALALAVSPQAVVGLGHQAVAAIQVCDVGQPVQQVVGVDCRAEHDPGGVRTGDALAVTHLVVQERGHGVVRVRHCAETIEHVVAIRYGLARSRKAWRGRANLVAQQVVGVADGQQRPGAGLRRDGLELAFAKVSV